MKAVHVMLIVFVTLSIMSCAKEPVQQELILMQRPDGNQQIAEYFPDHLSMLRQDGFSQSNQEEMQPGDSLQHRQDGYVDPQTPQLSKVPILPLK